MPRTPASGRPPKVRQRRSATTPTAVARMDAWLAAHRRAVWLSLALLAIAARAVYFVQLDSGPLIELHRLTETDMNYYDGWGRSIAGGDWLSRQVGVPMHPWHHDVARAYLETHPERRPELERYGDPDAALWREWLRPGQFYQDPLYAYLIGLTYRVAGPEPRAVLVWQLALGVGTVCLVWALTLQLFGDTAAAVAGALALSSAPLMYYELLLLRESTIAFAGLLVAWLSMRAFATGHAALFVCLGVAAGLAFTLKSTFVLVIAGLAIALLRARAGWLAAAAFVLGAAIPLTPFAARNIALGVPALAMASSGPLTFALSNAPGYVPLAGFTVDRPQLARVLGDTDGRLLSVVRETLRFHTFRGYVQLFRDKWDRTWHWFEIPNNDDFYYMRAQVPVLRWLPVTFWVIAPLALVGLVLAATRIRVAWTLFLIVASAVAPLVVFYVLGRFRTALVAAALPFAAYAAVQICTWLSEPGRRVRGAAAAAAVVLLLAFATGRPLPPGVPLIRPDDWMIPYVLEYGDRITTAVEAGDSDRAIAAFTGLFAYEPPPADLDPLTGGEIADAFARMHDDCAELFRKSGRIPQADAQAARASEFRSPWRLLAR